MFTTYFILYPGKAAEIMDVWELERQDFLPNHYRLFACLPVFLCERSITLNPCQTAKSSSCNEPEMTVGIYPQE